MSLISNDQTMPYFLKYIFHNLTSGCPDIRLFLLIQLETIIKMSKRFCFILENKLPTIYDVAIQVYGVCPLPKPAKR